MHKLISISDFQARLNRILLNQEEADVVIVTEHRNPRAVIVTPAEYERLVRLDPKRHESFRAFVDAKHCFDMIDPAGILDTATKLAAEFRELDMEPLDEEVV